MSSEDDDDDIDSLVESFYTIIKVISLKVDEESKTEKENRALSKASQNSVVARRLRGNLNKTDMKHPAFETNVEIEKKQEKERLRREAETESMIEQAV